MFRITATAIILTLCGTARSLAEPPPIEVRPPEVSWLSLSPDGSRLLLTFANPASVPGVGGDHALRWLPEMTNDPAYPRPHYGSARPIAFAGNDKILALISEKQFEAGDLVLWDLKERKSVFTLEAKCRDFRCAAVSADAKSLLIGYDGNIVRHFDLTTGKLRRQLGKAKDPRYSGNIIQATGFAADGKQAWAYTTEGGYLWDLETGKERELPKLDEGHLPRAISPDGKLLFASLNTGALQDEYPAAIWDLTSGKKRFDFAEQWQIGQPTFTPDGRFLIYCGQYGKIRKWDMSTGKPTLTLITHLLKQGNASAAAISADGKWAVTGTHNGMLKLWNLGKERFERLLLADPRFEIDDLTIADLKALANSADAPVRLAAVNDLAKLGKHAIPLLEERLKDANALVRIHAAKGLLDAEKKEQALAVWKSELDNRDVNVRAKIAGWLPVEDSAGLSMLLDLLQDKDALVRRGAARQIQGHLRWTKPGVREAMRKALTDDDAGVRVHAAATLWFPHGVMLDEKTSTMRAMDDSQPARFARIAVMAFNDPDPKTRIAAAFLTESITEKDAKQFNDVKDELRKALKNNDPWVQLAAARTLIALNSHIDEVVSAISGILTRDPAARQDYVASCLRRLDSLGSRAKAAAPALVALLGTDGGPANTLAQIGPDVLPEVIKVLDGKDALKRFGAVDVCWHFGAQAKDAVPALARALKDLKVDGLDSRSFVVETLGRIGPDAALALPALLDIIRDRKEPAALRAAAVHVLPKLGPKAKEAIPLLRTLAERDKAVVDAAKQALREIGAGDRE
jgi:WD40 repeat protein